VEAISSTPINKNLIIDKNVSDPEALGAVIADIFKKNRIKAKNVIAAMPYAQAKIATLDMPDGLNEIEQEDHVQLEAAGQLGYPVEQVLLDFNIIGASSSSDGMASVKMVAVKNDTPYQNRVAAIEDADLKMTVMDIENFAVERGARWLIAKNPLGQKDAIEAIIDIGHEFMTLDIIQNGKSVYTREQNFGIKQLTDEVGKRYGLSPDRAREDLINGSLPETFAQEILPQFRAEAATQVNRIIQFFFAAGSINRVHRIWLAGGGASLQGLDKEVFEVTGVTTKVANPFQHIYIGDNVDEALVKKLGPSFLLAFGLAIRDEDDGSENYNLMPWRAQRRKDLQKNFMSKIGLSAALAAGICVMAGLALTNAIGRQEDRNKYLADQIEVAEKQVTEIKELESKRDLALARKNVIETLQGNRDQVARVFQALAEASKDKSIAFTTMTHKGGMLEIIGRAGSNSVVATYLNTIALNPWIKNPEIVLIEAKPDSAENTDDPRTDIYMPYHFVIKTSLKNPNIPEVEEKPKEEAKKDTGKKKKPAKKKTEKSEE